MGDERKFFDIDVVEETHKESYIAIQTSPDGDYDLLWVMYRDEKGKPWLCVNEKGDYVNPDGKYIGDSAVAGLASIGAIGD